MAIADIQHNKVVREIIKKGKWQHPAFVKAVWEDGEKAPTKFLVGARMFFDNSEVPILTNKIVHELNARRELFWIWVYKSHRLADLRALGVKFWNKWEIKEGEWKGTIGPAYGYQLGKICRKFLKSKVRREHLNPNVDYIEDDTYIHLDQVDWLIQTLLTNPWSRHKVTSLWGVEDLDEMKLPPCVWNTTWVYDGELLHLKVGIRSNDIALGNPFNVYQYYVLQRMICQVTGHGLGTLEFKIDDAHLYDRHIEVANAQANAQMYEAPELWINPEVKNFYEFDLDKDFELRNYNATASFKYELAEA